MPRIRRSVSPSSLVDLIAPNSDYERRPKAPILGTSFHTSNTSHMCAPPDKIMTMDINGLGGSSRCGPRAAAEDNVPPRFELFLLGEGEKKVTEEADTRKLSPLHFPFHDQWSRPLITAWSNQHCPSLQLKIYRIATTYSVPSGLTTGVLTRYPVIFNLHFQQRRPHAWKSSPRTTPAIPTCHLLWLQSSSSTRQVS